MRRIRKSSCLQKLNADFMSSTYFVWGHAVAQLVKALRYKPEGCGFESRWCHWYNPSGRTVALGLIQPLTEMSTRNISGGKCDRCIGLTTLPPCADCLEIWEPQPHGNLRACSGLYSDCFTFALRILHRHWSWWINKTCWSKTLRILPLYLHFVMV